jgi:uncharacterized membrane protein YphA (DoxX/SURF4 family)
MDRLYSQYPGGAVGFALLLFRIAIGCWFMQDGVYRSIAPAQESEIQIVIGVLLATLAVLLVLGLRTSFVAIAGAGLLIASGLCSREAGGKGWFFLLLQVFLCASIALLGPGGYSLDARFSGWRSINISSGTKD